MSRRIQGRADSSFFPRLNIDFAILLALSKKEKVKPAGFPPVFETPGLLKKKKTKQIMVRELVIARNRKRVKTVKYDDVDDIPDLASFFIEGQAK